MKMPPSFINTIPVPLEAPRHPMSTVRRIYIPKTLGLATFSSRRISSESFSAEKTVHGVSTVGSISPTTLASDATISTSKIRATEEPKTERLTIGTPGASGLTMISEKTEHGEKSSMMTSRASLEPQTEPTGRIWVEKRTFFGTALLMLTVLFVVKLALQELELLDTTRSGLRENSGRLKMRVLCGLGNVE